MNDLKALGTIISLGGAFLLHDMPWNHFVGIILMVIGFFFWMRELD
jgi:hypothetical protein